MQSDWSPCASSGGGSRYLCGGLELEVEGAEDTTQEGVQQREDRGGRERLACLRALSRGREGVMGPPSLPPSVLTQARAHATLNY